MKNEKTDRQKTSDGSETFSLGISGGMVFGQGVFNQISYRSPTNYTMQVFGSDAQSQIRRKSTQNMHAKSLYSVHTISALCT